MYFGGVYLLRGVVYKQWVSYILTAALVTVIAFAAITVEPRVSTARAADAPAKEEAKRCFEGEVLKGLNEIELSEQAYRECEKPKESSTNNFWSRMATAAKDILGVLGFFALLAAGLAILAWIFVFFQIRGKKSRECWPSRKRLAPTLVVKSLDDTGLDKKVGPAIATLIRDQVKPTVSGGARVVTGHATIGDSLKPLGEISDEAKAAMGIITFLLSALPTREYEATGTLQVKGDGGYGISVETTKGSERIDSTTLWSKEFEAPETDESALQFLSIPAAAWVDHRMASYLGNADSLPKDPHVWALFNAGAAWQQRGEKDKARPLYERALTLDPDDFWSMSNLGVIEFVDGRYKKSEKLLVKALEALEGEPS
jgi:tetratricopeptide (TPR) repeat protein